MDLVEPMPAEFQSSAPLLSGHGLRIPLRQTNLISPQVQTYHVSTSAPISPSLLPKAWMIGTASKWAHLPQPLPTPPCSPLLSLLLKH